MYYTFLSTFFSEKFKKNMFLDKSASKDTIVDKPVDKLFINNKYKKMSNLLLVFFSLIVEIYTFSQ